MARVHAHCRAAIGGLSARLSLSAKERVRRDEFGTVGVSRAPYGQEFPISRPCCCVIIQCFRGARHAATTSGSGLGLWIAKAFVGANGGRIEVESAGINLGSTIAIKLPVAPNAPQHETDPDD